MSDCYGMILLPLIPPLLLLTPLPFSSSFGFAANLYKYSPLPLLLDTQGNVLDVTGFLSKAQNMLLTLALVFRVL